MKAGIVIYQRSGTSFIGKWSHEDVKGVFFKEIVHDVAPDSFEGDWPVEVFQGDDLLLKGRLSSVKLGDCFKLGWQKSAENDAATIAFQGIGYALDTATMVATFEPV